MGEGGEGQEKEVKLRSDMIGSQGAEAESVIFTLRQQHNITLLRPFGVIAITYIPLESESKLSYL